MMPLPRRPSRPRRLDRLDRRPAPQVRRVEVIDRRTGVRREVIVDRGLDVRPDPRRGPR
jgi:hypothetical protein